jgi:hypothetical protein
MGPPWAVTGLRPTDRGLFQPAGPVLDPVSCDNFITCSRFGRPVRWMMVDLPSGTVTFFFTDIDGSTALWERDRSLRPPFRPRTQTGHARARPGDAGFVAQPIQERLVQALPDAGFRPITQPPPTRRVAAAAEFQRQQAPLVAGAQHENDAAQGSAVGDTMPATLQLGRLLRT